MSETIKLCAMLVRHVFAPDDEARDEEMRRPFVEQAMRAKREHDEMRRELAEARATVTLLTEQRACDFRVMEGAQSLIAELTQERDASDTTRREWEVRAAESWNVGRDVGRSTALADVTRAITELGVDVPTDALPLVMDIADMIAKADRESHATGRAAGLREAAEVCHAIKQENGDDPRVWLVDYMEECEQRILALAPPAAETVRTETIFGCRTCPASTPGWTDGRFASPGWGRIDHIDGPNAICPVCAADPTSLDCLREEYPDVTPAAEPRDEGES